jgi:hypothetical protein
MAEDTLSHLSCVGAPERLYSEPFTAAHRCLMLADWYIDRLWRLGFVYTLPFWSCNRIGLMGLALAELTEVSGQAPEPVAG